MFNAILKTSLEKRQKHIIPSLSMNRIKIHKKTSLMERGFILNSI